VSIRIRRPQGCSWQPTCRKMPSRRKARSVASDWRRGCRFPEVPIDWMGATGPRTTSAPLDHRRFGTRGAAAPLCAASARAAPFAELRVVYRRILYRDEVLDVESRGARRRDRPGLRDTITFTTR
jgi:hypothetical protein